MNTNIEPGVEPGAGILFSAFPTRLFTVAEYHRLAETGVLGEDDRVELLEGVISPKMVHSPIHDATVSVVEQMLRPHLLAGWFLRVQSSITLDSSEPEPDIAVVKGPPGRYIANHPSGSDIALVIEIAETSLTRDRAKALMYARGGIACYWIVNLGLHKLEVYDSLDNGIYTRKRMLGVDQSVATGPTFDTGFSFAVDSIFV